MIYAFYTCTRVRWETDDEGFPLEDPVEEHGWVDRAWDPRVLHDNRNDVRPALKLDEGDPELLDDVREVIDWLPGGGEDDWNGTFYSREPVEPSDEPWSYCYAVHFVRKFYGPRGWTEEAWVPPLG